MKKIIILNLFILIGASVVVAQKQKTTTQPQPVQQQPQTSAKTEQPAINPLAVHFARKHSIATRWADPDVAKDALYDLIVEYPDSDSLIFALALSYYETNKFAPTVLIGQDLLQRSPKNTQLLELVAEGFQGLNIPDRALQNYESLYLITSNSSTLYKMTFLQFGLKRYPECITNADILLGKPDAETIKVVFNDAAGKEKEYPMKVALLNLKGMVYRDQEDKVNAKKFFDQALAVAPDFLPAKENLANLAKLK